VRVTSSPQDLAEPVYETEMHSHIPRKKEMRGIEFNARLTGILVVLEEQYDRLLKERKLTEKQELLRLSHCSRMVGPVSIMIHLPLLIAPPLALVPGEHPLTRPVYHTMSISSYRSIDEW
jgi:hypothetical protein